MGHCHDHVLHGRRHTGVAQVVDEDRAANTVCCAAAFVGAAAAARTLLSSEEVCAYLGLNQSQYCYGGASWPNAAKSTRYGLDLLNFTACRDHWYCVSVSKSRNGFASCGGRLIGTDVRLSTVPGRDETGQGEVAFRAVIQ